MIRKDDSIPIQAYEVAHAAGNLLWADGFIGEGMCGADVRKQAHEQFETWLNAYIDQRIAASKEKP
jgi:hypothetical protein